jgi:hypothetical protein
VSPSDDEKAQSNAQTTRAVAEADARKLELARNRLEYTTLRASQDGVVTASSSRSARSSPKGSRSSRSPRTVEPEIVVNVPEDRWSASRRRATRPR